MGEFIHLLKLINNFLKTKQIIDIQ